MATTEPPQKNTNHLPQWIFGFCAGGLTILYLRRLYFRHMQRIPNADHVTPAMFAEKSYIKGVVTSVGDADGFRLFHTPRLSCWSFKLKRVPTKNLKDQTISIRIAGVDAPEGAHFGNDAQPFAAESKTWLKNRILRKTVKCQLLHRDQYSRIVANVSLPIFGILFSKNLALEMLRKGWATTYEQASAQYGKEGKDAYIAAEKQAKAKRHGMWKRGTNIETPAEYKRKHRQLKAPKE